MYLWFWCEGRRERLERKRFDVFFFFYFYFWGGVLFCFFLSSHNVWLTGNLFASGRRKKLMCVVFNVPLLSFDPLPQQHSLWVRIFSHKNLMLKTMWKMRIPHPHTVKLWKPFPSFLFEDFLDWRQKFRILGLNWQTILSDSCIGSGVFHKAWCYCP